MKKQYLLLSIAIIFFGSCSNDEGTTTPPGEENATPQLIATVDQSDVTTRSGVVEDNDYTAGEKFYWTNGDATTVFFVDGTMTNPMQYKSAEYSANVASGVKSNSCEFNVTRSGGIANGDYTAYGFFPSSTWKMDNDYSDFLEAHIPTYQQQSDATSTHLGPYMLMKAEKNVTVNSSSPISLSYKHLASVLRFDVWNNSGDANLKLNQINVNLTSNKKVFGTAAKLDNIDDPSLTINSNANVLQLILEMTGAARNFSLKADKQQCQGYMAVLPTATDAFETGDDLYIQLSLTDGINNYTVTKHYNVGGDLDFLENGIMQGKSYYFQIEVNSRNLNQVIGTTYSVGDYWPDATYPEGIVFWVKPGTFGTQGKVVGFGETTASKWGLNNDEKAGGVIDIRNLISGAVATRSLTYKYYVDLTAFEANYPAFHYIYSTVNGNNIDGGWYLPARDELRMLFAGCSGKVYEGIVNWTGSNMPGYDSPECEAARLAFNDKLTAKGGAVFGSSGEWWYLSSSEIADVTYYIVNLETGTYSSDSKNKSGGVRWIRNF